MASATLTYDEILDAARRLPARKRKCLVEDLTSAALHGDAVKVARQLRPAFRLSPKKQRRLSLLLEKGNAAKLSLKEQREVDALVDEVESRMLEFAKSVDSALGDNARPKGRNGSVGP